MRGRMFNSRGYGTFPLETQDAVPHRIFLAEGEASEDGRTDLFCHAHVLRQILSLPTSEPPTSKQGWTVPPLIFGQSLVLFREKDYAILYRLTVHFLKGGNP